MTWYTLKWEDQWEGCMVEHFPTRKMAERRNKEIKEVSTYSQTYSITEHTVRGKRELIAWLNNHFTTENG